MVETIKLQPDTFLSMCAVCVSDRSGGQIALLIIVSSLILLGLANWTWKKYSKNIRKIFTENKLYK